MYAKEDCSIPPGMGNYIPVQTNSEITGEVLIEISGKTFPGLVLPDCLEYQEEVRLYLCGES